MKPNLFPHLPISTLQKARAMTIIQMWQIRIWAIHSWNSWGSDHVLAYRSSSWL